MSLSSSAGSASAAVPGHSRAVRRARKVARLVFSVALTLLGLLALTFFIGRMLPIDPVLAVVGDQADQSTYDQMYRKLGLDKPLYVQFWNYVTALAQLDLGVGTFSGREVTEDIARVFPATLELATVALLVGVLLGVPMGVLAAVFRGSLIDHVARVVGLIGYSTPIFWLGLMGLLLFFGKLGWVGGPGQVDAFYIGVVEPVTGLIFVDSAMAGEWEIFRNAVSHVILPGSILGFTALAYISRMTRSLMLDQLSQEYVITARAKGLSRRQVVWRHAFRNTAVPLVTVIALSYGFLLEGAVLTETVFAWPGFGQYLTNALLQGDMNAVLGCTLVIGVIFIGLNLLSDLLYQFLDPRTRE